MRKYLLSLAMLFGYFLTAFGQPLSQTRTANLFNNTNEAYLNLWAQASSQYFSADDNSYAYSKKLSSHRGFLLLVLQDFHFDIPPDATIENITVTATRFKKGRGSVQDYFATLVKSPDLAGVSWSEYGVRWQLADYYPSTETAVYYSESGAGNNGGVFGDQLYQWTPAIINDAAFGVRIQNYDPVGGSAVVYYDLVQITVRYSSPAVSRKAPTITETKPLKEPIVYPNPFTTKTNIQFTAAESGNAVVELLNISGVKVRTLFSGAVIRGQVYNVLAGDAHLPKGIYVYMINVGRQKQMGRIIKVE
jgi:hypothetical protein